MFLRSLRDQGKSKSRILSVLRTLRSVLKYAAAQDWIERDPLFGYEYTEFAEEQSPLHAEATPEAFTDDEVAAILAQRPPEPYRTLILMRVATGLRINEAFALQWKQVDLDQGTVLVERTWDAQARNKDGSRGRVAQTKTKESRRVKSLPTVLLEHMSRLKSEQGAESDDLMFPNREGHPLSYHNFSRRVWRPLVAKAKVRALTFNSLRHTYGTMLVNSGVSVFIASRAMGHTREATTLKHYVRVLPSTGREAAAVIGARLFGDQPQLRVIEGGKSRGVREALDGDAGEGVGAVASR